MTGPGDPPAPGWSFAERVIDWQRTRGRHGLPWQASREAYRVWLSEIMLQQTQVTAVIPYYARFLERFPDVRALARAGPDEVLRLWSGLGYYSRARNLHACAQRVVDEHGGEFPREAALLAELPGIGRSTAAAIASFAWGAREAILDGNVKRVLARAFGIEGFPGAPAIERRLWALAQSLLPSPQRLEADPAAMGAYTQGLMDLGATVCVRGRPRCEACPLAADCVARREGRTAELPTARPRRELPRRATAMLLLRDGARVLVERRPPVGIWGGLWSLPETQAGAPPLPADAAASRAVADEARARFGLPAAAVEPLACFEHAFTHYRLEVRPWLVDVAPAGADAGVLLRAEEPGRSWLEAADVADAGLPQPVKRLLASLFAPSLL